MPCDLTLLNERQHETCIENLAMLSMSDLRQRQDFTVAQIEMAFEKKDRAALANLQIMEDHLRQAVDLIG